MIKEDYVSLETAKLLKEKGFDEKCMSYYGHGEFQLGHPEYMKSNTDRDGVACNGVPYDAYNAPTLQMAMKWLREVHNLWCEISWEGKGLWCMEVFSLMDEEFIPGSIVHEIKSYEEACEAAIKYCLENLI